MTERLLSVEDLTGFIVYRLYDAEDRKPATPKRLGRIISKLPVLERDGQGGYREVQNPPSTTHQRVHKDLGIAGPEVADLLPVGREAV